MKQKIIQIILIAFIVFMIGGVLSSIDSKQPNDVTIISEEFEQIEQYDTTGYTIVDPFKEEDANELSKFNEKVGKVISKGISKLIDTFFEFLKKIVS